MKVCGKKDIHVPGCDDCQELEERVEAVEECCDDAHDEIDTLTTDKADKTYVDDSIDNVNQTIVDVADTLGERIDNIITASESSVTTLWEGVMESIGDSANLSEDVNDFDYLDIYYRTSVDESEGYYNTVRIPADQFANYTITVGGTMSPLAESPILKQYLTQLSFVDDTATIDNIREWSWNGSQSSDASDDQQAETGVTIYRIDGVKEAGGSLEIADAREGVDGTVYPSLGDAIRGQIQDTRDMIPQLVKTVNGNPIVLDDAFGEVKNLDVELTPIQDLHGYDKPWAAGAINKINAVTPITVTGQTTLGTFNTSKQGIWSASVKVTNNAQIRGYLNMYIYNGSTLATQKSAAIEVGATDALVSATIDLSAVTFTEIRVVITGASAGYNLTIKGAQLNEGQPLDQIYPFSNICPITGHDSVTVTDTGKNLFDKNNFTALDDVYLNYGTNTLTSGGGNRGIVMPIEGGKTYTISYQVSNATDLHIATFADYPAVGSVCLERAYTSAQAGYKTMTLTTSATAKYIFFKYNYTYATQTYTAQQVIDGIQLEHGSQATSYEPYKSQPKTVTLPHTVYGGKPNITTGNGTETQVIFDLGERNYSITGGAFYTVLTDGLIKGYYGQNATEAYCDIYARHNNNPAMTGEDSVWCVGSNYWNGSQCWLAIKDTRYTTVADFKQAVSGHKFVYTLATPTDLSTTPTDITLYNGDNVVSSDGDMELTYVQDMAIVIRKIESQL